MNFLITFIILRFSNFLNMLIHFCFRWYYATCNFIDFHFSYQNQFVVLIPCLLSTLNINCNILIILLTPPLLNSLFVNQFLGNLILFKLCFQYFFMILLKFFLFFDFQFQYVSLFFQLIYLIPLFLISLHYEQDHYLFVDFSFFFFILVIDSKFFFQCFIFRILKHFLLIFLWYPENWDVCSYEPSKLYFSWKFVCKQDS
jgi:hypothetical protein